MQYEFNGCGDSSSAVLTKQSDFKEVIGMEGFYIAECFDKDGNLKWSDRFENQVVQEGKVLMLNTFLSGSTYTTNGPYIGLVNGASTPTFSPTDTFATHAGWTEFTSYTFGGSGVRGTAAFANTATGNNSSTSGSNVVTKTTSTILVYTFTAGGTIAGCFLVTGTGATAAFSNVTNGTLYSAGAFTGGNKTVASTDQLNVTYSTTATS
jgi:hypothetical protein